MDATARLLTRLIERTDALIRLQKMSLVLQAEAMAYRSAAADAAGPRRALDRRIVQAVRQMRKTADRIEAGKGLLR